MVNEKRLIDANALMDAFRNYMVERHDRVLCASEENCKVCERECLWRSVVKNAPTVDAVEVVHGHMVERIVDHECPWYTVCNCSECGCTVERWHNYCPNCGAKMDGDGNG